MTYFNFFEEYKKEYHPEKAVINRKRLTFWLILLVLVCAEVYALLYFVNYNLQSEIDYVENIKNDPAFLTAYSESLEIKTAGENIGSESLILARLKEYETAENLGNIRLLEKIKSCFSPFVTIDSVQIAGTYIEITGQYLDQRYLEESMTTLQNTGLFSDILCENAKSNDVNGGSPQMSMEDGTPSPEDPAEEEPAGEEETGGEETGEETKIGYTFEMSMILLSTETEEAAEQPAQEAANEEG